MKRLLSRFMSAPLLCIVLLVLENKKARGLAPPGLWYAWIDSLQLQATATRPWAKEAPVQGRQQQQVAIENIVQRLSPTGVLLSTAFMSRLISLVETSQVRTPTSAA
jgi:hypothetical protein